ncbi:hypothetical protein AB833_00885 [Chromatiales bacterium (ex Bugula neritina AB1)]|nr:hypothetical protein AB833_00885 [Chromatiales bacterium (ex Bugula neritina AB1)]
MLVFHQPGCPYCNFFVERNLAQKDIESLVRSEFDAIEINMWGDREVTSVSGEEFTEKTFARQLKVQFTPTVLMFSKEGELALRINGYYPPDKFRAALDYVINDKNTQQSFTDYLASSGSGATANSNQVIARPVYISTDDFNTSDPITLVTEKTDKPYILLFEQKDCSNCELLHNTVLSASESRELLEKFDVVRVDMWGTDDITRRNGETVTGKELARQLQVSYAPTMILYAADHTEVIRSESWLKRFHTQSMLDYVQSDAWRHQPEFQRYLSERGDTIRESGQSVNILE